MYKNAAAASDGVATIISGGGISAASQRGILAKI